MKVAIIGSHGVGKTSLCEMLVARMRRAEVPVGLVSEVARRCPFRVGQETSLAAQFWILYTQEEAERIEATRSTYQICDRSTLDNYAYLVKAFGRQRRLEKRIRKRMESYDLIIKLPVWQPPEPDGFRDVDETFQNEVDCEIEKLMDEFLDPWRCYRLPVADLNTWAEQVLSWMRLPSDLCLDEGSVMPLESRKTFEPTPVPARERRPVRHRSLATF